MQGLRGSVRSSVRVLPSPLPPIREQKRIVTKLDELMQYCDLLEESILNSQQRNEMLLKQFLREILISKSEEGIETEKILEGFENEQV